MGPSSDDAHDLLFFRRHEEDDPRQPAPGREFLNACPTNVRVRELPASAVQQSMATSTCSSPAASRATTVTDAPLRG